MATDFATAEAKVIELGSRRELFVDRYLIDEMEGATLKLQEPRPAGGRLPHQNLAIYPLSLNITARPA